MIYPQMYRLTLIMIKNMYDRLGSLNFGLWLMAGVTVLLGVGSFVTGPEESGRLNSMPLFDWLTATPLSAGWWLWLTIALLALLAVNTLLCSVDSLRQKRGRPGLLLRLAPQVMHAGFLLIVLAHLVSSVGGYRESGQIGEGGVISLPGGQITVERLEAKAGAGGYVTDFSATVVAADGRRAVIRPNDPFFFRGFGLYVKYVELYPVKISILEIHREPGAGPALAGALLFTIGNVVVVAKRRQERSLT